MGLKSFLDNIIPNELKGNLGMQDLKQDNMHQKHLSFYLVRQNKVLLEELFRVQKVLYRELLVVL